MREHIYKAKRIDNGEWVEGLPIRSHIGFSSRIDTIQYSFGGYLPTHKIDPETLCEYTGLKDKNGNKIFENDILTDEKTGGFIGDVQFHYGVFGVEFDKFKKNKQMLGSWGNLHNLRTFEDGHLLKYFEVIGNKYDKENN